MTRLSRLPRLDALSRLHALAQASEVAALPCTPERAVRGQRKDLIARAWHAELLAGAGA